MDYRTFGLSTHNQANTHKFERIRDRQFCVKRSVSDVKRSDWEDDDEDDDEDETLATDQTPSQDEAATATYVEIFYRGLSKSRKDHKEKN